MDLLAVLKQRHSVRNFLPTPVPRALITELIVAAGQAPSACNLQLTQFVVVDDRKILRELSTVASYKFSWAPCILVVLHDPQLSRQRAAGIFSAGMAVENMCLRATDLNLATCPIAGFNNDRTIKKILQIPADLEILLLLAVGFPDPHNPPSLVEKLPPTARAAYNNYSGLPRLNKTSSLAAHSVTDIIDYRQRIGLLYLDRWHLHTLATEYYAAAANFLVDHSAGGPLLDVISYDGFWIKYLQENFPQRWSITSSDYLPAVRKFLSTALQVTVTPLTAKQQFPDLLAGNQPLITLIYQAEFTPDLKTLFLNIRHQLTPDGLFFLATYNESWYKKLAKKIINYWRARHGQPTNIYENNPFYRVGPINFLSDRTLKKIAGAADLVLQKQATKNFPHRGGRANFYLWRRSSDRATNPTKLR